jgi:uncharacterized protein YneF (UPF0154 family)
MSLGAFILSASKYFKKSTEENPKIKQYKTAFYLDENGKLCRNPLINPRLNT